MNLTAAFCPTSIAILLPTIVLTVLVSAAACSLRPRRIALRYSDHPDWPRIEVCKNLDLVPSARAMLLLRGAVFVSAMIFATFAIVGLASFLGLAYSFSYLEIADVVLYAIIALPFIWLAQALKIQFVDRATPQDKHRSRVLMNEVVFVTATFLCYSLWVVPTVQLFLIYAGISSESIVHLRYYVHFLSAFSDVPSCIAGLSIVFAVYSRQRELRFYATALNNESLATLPSKSPEQLDQLIEAAMKLRQPEIADKISRHLLASFE